MPTYTAPTKDMQFVLHDVLKVSEQTTQGYNELERDFTAAVLEEAGKLSMEVLAPLNLVGDEKGCTLENGVVRTPEGFKDAYDKMREGGWMGLDADPEYGGQGMPYVLHSAVGEMFSAANMAFNMYQGLTHGAMSAIYVHGSEQQKATYLPNMIDGIWSGTMNLTEPHCGTDLGLIRTKAEPQDNGSYKISGQKIWISAGEHDMTDNIIHLVLAKIPGGPEGVKGISLFIVPKFLVNEDGSLGERNTLSCGGLEKKMGIHGNATCVMNYDGATGLLDRRHAQGHARNVHDDERSAAGCGPARLCPRGRRLPECAGLCPGPATRPSSDRDGGAGKARRPDHRPSRRTPEPDGPESFLEGARAFTYWGATLIDQSHREKDEEAEALISLLTPVLKGFLTDKGFETTVLAQQTLGGSGFTREWGLEQFVRDGAHHDDLRRHQRHPVAGPRWAETGPERRQDRHGLF